MKLNLCIISLALLVASCQNNSATSGTSTGTNVASLASFDNGGEKCCCPRVLLDNGSYEQTSQLPGQPPCVNLSNRWYCISTTDQQDNAVETFAGWIGKGQSCALRADEGSWNATIARMICHTDSNNPYYCGKTKEKLNLKAMTINKE